jgi:membrane fusion protein, multidrug efflux system
METLASHRGRANFPAKWTAHATNGWTLYHFHGGGTIDGRGALNYVSFLRCSNRMMRAAMTRALLGASCFALWGCGGKSQAPAPPPPEVSVMEVKPGPITVYNEYVAQTQAPDTIEIRSQVTGLLEKQAFEDGARVRKGDLLYVIDQRPFEAQVAQAAATVAQAEANLINARQNLARNARLVAQHAISQQDYEAAVAQEKASAALVDAQKALLRDAEINLEFTTIRARRDGVMSSSLVKPGALITAQQTLMDTLYSNDPMWATFTLSEDRLLELQKSLKHPPGERPDQAPPFRIRLADGSDYALPGRLNFVDAAIDQKSGTLQVRISLPNPERLLRPGLFVRVIVPAFENSNAIRVPQRAIRELQGLKSVYVVAADDKVEDRPVVATRRIDNDWVIDKGLAPGDRVIVDGIAKVRPGVQVRPVLAAASSSLPAGAPSAQTGAAATTPGAPAPLRSADKTARN